MEILCPKCSKPTASPVDFEVVQFGCPNCKNLISYKNEKEGLFIKKFEYASEEIALAVGQKGVLEGKEYAVTGIIVKRVQRIYHWREYFLRSAEGDVLYLSETDGHWILLREVADAYEVSNYPRYLTHDDISMNLYDYDDTTIVQAEGFFDYVLPTKNQQMIEYIQPPYIISIEKYEGKEATFFGEHISAGKVKKAFNVTTMPKKVGVGIVQPFRLNLRNLAIILSSAALLILFTHVYFYRDREAKVVLSEHLTFSEYNGKDFVSKPFTLEGGSAPMTISLNSDVNNSWAAAQVALVNEITNEEEYAGKDIEYYSGYEEGTHWTEGSTSEEFNICGVAAGRYHLIVTPQKAPEDMSNNYIRVKAVWSQPSMWNVYMPILFMGLVVVMLYFLRMYFEQRRWADSSFSPHS